MSFSFLNANRCPELIITLANSLIANNVGRTPGKIPITARNTAGLGENVVRYSVFPSPDDEVKFLPRDLESRGLKAADCVVLARTARLLDSAESALRNAGYEVYVARRKSEFESPALRVLMETLRLANARHDRDILRRLCLAWEGLAGETLELDAVTAAAALSGGDFLRAWGRRGIRCRVRTGGGGVGSNSVGLGGIARVSDGR